MKTTNLEGNRNNIFWIIFGILGAIACRNDSLLTFLWGIGVGVRIGVLIITGALTDPHKEDK